jgi:hypothetical protein
MATLPKIVPAAALALALATAPASAFSIPNPFPDITTGVSPITFTQWSGAGIWQQVQSSITSLENEAKNLFGIGTLGSNPLSAITPLLAPRTVASPDVAANAAASTLQQAPITAQQLQALDTKANASQGAHTDAEATNDYLSHIATAQDQANVLHAQEIKQKQDDQTDEQKVLGVYFSGQD